MAVTALGLGAILAATDVNATGYFAAITLYSIIGGAYIGIRMASEDESKPSGRTARRTRRGSS